MTEKIKEVNVDELLGILVSLTDNIPNLGSIEYHGLVEKRKGLYVIADPERGDIGLGNGDDVNTGKEVLRIRYPR